MRSGLLSEIVEMVAVNAIVGGRERWRAHCRSLLRAELRRSGLAGYVTPLVVVGVRRGRLVVEARGALWEHLAFRSDPLNGQSPTRPGA